MRKCLMPIIGLMCGCGFVGFAFVAFLIMVIIFAVLAPTQLNGVFQQYAISKAVSIAAGVAPVGLVQYALLRRQEKAKAATSGLPHAAAACVDIAVLDLAGQ